MNINYSENMSNVIDAFPVGVPIFTDTVAKRVAIDAGVSMKSIKKNVNLNLKRLADNHVIERIQKGVYYKAKITAFGKSRPPIDLVISETCMKHGGKKIGYIGGETLLHDLGLTSLTPKNKVIVTNKCRVKVPKESHIILKKPVTEITDENVKYLQLIDAIAMLETEYIDAKNSGEIIRCALDTLKLDKLVMMKIAKKYYSRKILLLVLDILLEDDYEITRG